MFFWIAFGSMIAALIAWGVWLHLRWKDMPALADIVYDERIGSGELPKHVDREAFTAAFIEAEGPRKETYRWGAATVSLFLLPLLVRLFNAIWHAFWLGAGKPPVFEAGYMLHTFCTFLFAMGIIVGIIYLTMRRFYSTAPPSLKSQIRTMIGDKA